MLSILRDLPWPIIIKVLSLGIACKTLYVFYSDPQNETPKKDLCFRQDVITETNEPCSQEVITETNEPCSQEVITETNEPRSQDVITETNEPRSQDVITETSDSLHSDKDTFKENSSEFNVINMKINILYIELIKIIPQLEKIQSTLDSLKFNCKENRMTDSKHTVSDISKDTFIPLSCQASDNLIGTHLNQETTQLENVFESHDSHVEKLINLNIHVKNPDDNALHSINVKQSDDRVKESDERVKESDDRVKESDDRVKESDERVKESDELFKESDELFKESEDRVKESEDRVKESDDRVKESDERFKEADDRVKESDERFKESDERVKESDELVKESDDRVKEADDRVKESDAIDTPKNLDKTCSFILRSGLRKGQSCNSKVKGRHQYCGLHR